MKRPEPIEDYYGTEITVDLVYKSGGVFVYLERVTTEPDPNGLHGAVVESFDRLTPEQALDLAERLKHAAECA